MYSCSEAFKTCFMGFGRQIELSATVDGVLYDAESIESISPTSEGGMLSAVMRTLEINLLHVSSVTKGASASVTIKVKNGTTWESLNLSGYKVYDQKYDDGADRLTITCYDSMLLSMVPYDLNLTYPKTVKQLLQAICSRLGYTLGTSTFPNSAKSLAADPFAGIGYTFRDALTEIAQATGRTIVLVGSSLRLVQITDTGFSITPNNLRSLTMGEHIGPINSIVLARTPQEDNVYLRDETSVTANGLHEYRIENNLLMDSDRSSFLPAILSELNGLEYDAIELNTYGLPWLDACDGIHVTDMDGNRHYVAVFNNSCSIGKGITGSLKTDPPSATKTDYKTAAKTDKAIRRTELIVDKQAGQIAGIVEDMRDLDETLSSRITQTADAITAEVTRATAAEGMLQSSISQQADQILMTVQKLENIGGRNLIINTMEPGEDPDVRPRLLKQSVGTRAVPSDAQCKVYASDFERHGFRFVLTTPGQLIIYFGDTFSNATMNGLEAGKTYTVSGKVYRKLLSNYSGSAEYVVRCILRTDDGGGNDWVTSASKDIATVTPGQDLTKDFTWTFTVPTGVTKTQIAVFCNDNTASDYAVGDFIALRYLKLETGELATGWTPAPEDHTEYADAKFQITADSIAAEVSRATAAEGTLSSRITQTAESITSEVTRATEAEGQLNSRITQQADQIELTIQKVENIGGRNLIVNTLDPRATPAMDRPRLLEQPVGTWAAPDDAQFKAYSIDKHGFRVVLATPGQPVIYFGAGFSSATMNGLVAGRTYTMSGRVYRKLMSNYSGSTSSVLRFRLRTDTGGASTWVVSGTKDLPVTPGSDIIRNFEWTFTVPSDATKTQLSVLCTDQTAADYAAGDFIALRELKLEEGEVATAWTPAPEDQVGATEIISRINMSPESITIEADRISLAGKTIDLTSDNIVINSTNFSVSESGEITATAGHIGRYEISATYLRAFGTSGDSSTCVGMGGNQAFWAGSSSSNSAPFRVSYAGELVSTAGNIGGWEITSSRIQKQITSGSSVQYRAVLYAPTSPTGSTAAFCIADETGSSTVYPLRLEYDGTLRATKAVITGSVTATSGEIGGFTIDSTSIRNGELSSTSAGAIGLSTDGFARTINGTSRTLRFAIGSKFGVTSSGVLYASDVNVTGSITATSGSIAGSLVTSGISADNITAGTLSASRIAANSISVSKLTGTITNSGWSIDLEAGTFTIGNISADNITTGTLSADRVGAGSFTITGGSVDITTSSQSTSKIKLSGNGYSTSMAAEGIKIVSNSGTIFVGDASSYGLLNVAGKFQITAGSGITNVVTSYGNLVNVGQSNSSSGTATVGGTSTNITSVTLTAGKWVVSATAYFPSNSTGYRRISLTTSSGYTTDGFPASAPACNGVGTYLTTSGVFVLTGTATVYLTGVQNSGTTLSVTGSITAVRVI